MVAMISDRSLARIAAGCRILGTIALTLYFNAPALTSCPCASAFPQLSAFIRIHPDLLYAGVWLQATGTLLSVIFFLTIVHLARATNRLSGLIAIVAAASLLTVVLVEGTFLAAIPQAVSARDTATFTTAFALSNGVFIRIYPLAPASVTYLALGTVILGPTLLPRLLGYVALGFGVGFEIAGLLAVFSGIGLILVVILATGQELWIILAAIALWRSRLSSRRGSQVGVATR